MTDELPKIMFDPQKDWCPRHLEPFRERWPRGWLLATLALFDEFVRSDEIIKACGDGDTDRLPWALREFGPMCCHAGDELTSYWTKLALGSIGGFKKARETKFGPQINI